MARVLKEFNLGHEGILAQIKEVLAVNADFYTGIQICCVAYQQNGKWRNALCVIRGITKEAGLSAPRPKLEYPALMFLERVIEPNELPALLDELRSKQLPFSGDVVELGQNGIALNSYELLAGENAYSSLPGYFYEAGRESATIPREPLIDYKAPFFPTPHHAVRDWVRIRGFHLDQDGRLGSVLLFLPECRARFESLACSAGALQLGVHRKPSTDIELKLLGRLRTKNGEAAVDELIRGDALKVPVSGELESIEIYLLGSDNTIFDYHKEDAFHSTGHRRLLAQEEPRIPDDAFIRKAAGGGESETVEYKPFIELGHEKLNEVIETVIAFSNTKGGSVLLGVDNHCVIKGIEREVARAAAKANKPVEDFMREYAGAIRQRIGGTLNRSVALAFSEQHVDGHLVLAITVPEGTEKPYYRLQSKLVYLRRGSNNVVADPETELPALRPADRRLASLFGR